MCLPDYFRAILSLLYSHICADLLISLFPDYFPPTAESFGVSAKLGAGALWGSHAARFREVPRFQEKDPGGSKVPRKGSKKEGSRMGCK